MIDLAHPAFVGGDIFRLIRRRVLMCAVHVDDRIANQSAGMAKNRSAWDWRALEPFILLRVVDLNIADRVGL